MSRKFNAAIIRSLLRVKVKDEEVWRTSENGKHYKIETETGEIKTGLGELNGTVASGNRASSKNVGEYLPKQGNSRRNLAQGWNKERSKYLEDRGHNPEDVSKLEGLVQRHIQHAHSSDDEIREFAKQHPDLIKDIGEFEKQAAKIRDELERERIDQDIAWAKESIADLDSFDISDDDKQYYKEQYEQQIRRYKTERERVGEDMLYRQGGYDGEVVSFTTNPQGVTLYPDTDYEQNLYPDHQNTLTELIDMGFIPVAGYGAKQNFYGGEGSEVTFIRVGKGKTTDSFTTDEEIWRSDEDGRHFKIETETGEIKAGFGGKLNGVKIKPKGERTEKPAEVTKLYETRGFKAISHNARDYKDYNSFVKSITPEQRDLIQKQHRRTETTETLKDYTERIRKLMAEHPAEEIRRENKVVQGKDILSTFERRKDKFQFEIDDVVDAQGFNGVPKVVPKAEFDKAVKEANGGKGFIAQRTYSAPNQETLDSYRDMLYHGDWYINCETGGAQYGQGMYCAADYEGNLTEGIRAEMLHYKVQYENDTDEKVPRDDWMDTAVSHLYESAPYAGADFLKWANDNKDFINEWADAFYDRDHTKSKELMERVPSGNLENLSIVNDLLRGTPRYQTTPSFTETFTLDPSAKIIEYNQLRSQYFDTLKNAMQKVNDDVARDRIEAMGLPEDEANYLKWKLGVKPYDVEQGSDYISKQSLESKRGLIQLRQAIESDIENAQAVDRTIGMLRYMDMGVYATMMGYDAINAANHGESGSYTVVLNRTKCIFLEP